MAESLDLSGLSPDDLKRLADAQDEHPELSAGEILRQYREFKASPAPESALHKGDDYAPPYPGRADEPYTNLARMAGNIPYSVLHRGVLPFVPGTKEAQSFGEGLIGLGKAVIPGTDESAAMGQAMMNAPSTVLKRLMNPRQLVEDLSLRAVDDPFSTALDMTMVGPPALRIAAKGARLADRIQAGGKAAVARRLLRGAEEAAPAVEAGVPAGYIPVVRGTAKEFSGFQGSGGRPEVWFIEGHTPESIKSAEMYAKATQQASGGHVTPHVQMGFVKESDILPRFEGIPERGRMGGNPGDPIAVSLEGVQKNFIPITTPPKAMDVLRSEPTIAGEQTLIPGAEGRVVPDTPLPGARAGAGLEGLPLSAEGQEAAKTIQGGLFDAGEGKAVEAAAAEKPPLSAKSQADIERLKAENPALEPQDIAKMEDFFRAQDAAQALEFGPLSEYHRDFVSKLMANRDDLIWQSRELAKAAAQPAEQAPTAGRSLGNILKTEFGGANYHKAGLAGELEDVSPARYMQGFLSKKAGTSPDIIVDFLKKNYPEFNIQSESDLLQAIRGGGDRLTKGILKTSGGTRSEEAEHALNDLHNQLADLEEGIRDAYLDAKVPVPEGLFKSQPLGITNPLAKIPYEKLARDLDRWAEGMSGADSYRMTMEGLRGLGRIPSGARQVGQWATSRAAHLMGGPLQEAFYEGGEATARGQGGAFLQAARGKMPMYGEDTPGTMENIIRTGAENLKNQKEARYQKHLPNLALRNPAKPLSVAEVKQDFIDRLAKFHIKIMQDMGGGGGGEWDAILARIKGKPMTPSPTGARGMHIPGASVGPEKEVLDFSDPRVTIKNRGERNQLQAVLDEINEYSKHIQGGPDDIAIMDAFKRRMWKNQLRDVSGRFKETNRIIGDTHDAIRSQLGERVAGYNELTKDYQLSQRLENQINQKFALHKDNSAQLANSLMGILSTDPKNQLGRQIVKELERASGAPLRAQIAGFSVSPREPSGMVGRWVQRGALVGIPLSMVGAGGGLVAATPLAALIPATILTTPRAMGMLMMAFGLPRASAVHMEKWARTVRGMIPPGMSPDMIRSMSVAALVNHINEETKKQAPATIPGRSDSVMVSSSVVKPSDVRQRILGR